MKLGIGLFLISLAVSFVLISPGVKERTLAWLVGSEREVLSQLEMALHGDQYKVLKVRSPKGLLVEIYKSSDGGFNLIDSALLPDKKDAFYKFEDQSHNLFLKDINGDGQADIILPTLDRNMKARLNVYIFDPVNEKLQSLN